MGVVWEKEIFLQHQFVESVRHHSLLSESVVPNPFRKHAVKTSGSNHGAHPLRQHQNGGNKLCIQKAKYHSGFIWALVQGTEIIKLEVAVCFSCFDLCICSSFSCDVFPVVMVNEESVHACVCVTLTFEVLFLFMFLSIKHPILF